MLISDSSKVIRLEESVKMAAFRAAFRAAVIALVGTLLLTSAEAKKTPEEAVIDHVSANGGQVN